MSRRHFLRQAALVATGGLMAACALPPVGTTVPVYPVDPTLMDVQVPLTGVAQDEIPEVDADLLARFLVLSSILTGIEDLNPEVGRIYLHSLQQRSEPEVTVNALLEQVTAAATVLPTSLAEVESSGIFDNEATRALADKITEYWYTGIYEDADGEQVVATFIDALAWKSLVFTKPMTVCGTYRFWTEPPEAALD